MPALRNRIIPNSREALLGGAPIALLGRLQGRESQKVSAKGTYLSGDEQGYRSRSRLASVETGETILEKQQE